MFASFGNLNILEVSKKRKFGVHHVYQLWKPNISYKFPSRGNMPCLLLLMMFRAIGRKIIVGRPKGGGGGGGGETCTTHFPPKSAPA